MKKPNICLLICQFLQIDDDIIQEVIKMGFDKNQLVESLHSRISNEVFRVIRIFFDLSLYLTYSESVYE